MAAPTATFRICAAEIANLAAPAATLDTCAAEIANLTAPAASFRICAAEIANLTAPAATLGICAAQIANLAVREGVRVDGGPRYRSCPAFARARQASSGASARRACCPEASNGTAEGVD